MLAPAVLAGILAGRRIVMHINQDFFEMLVLGLSAVGGLSLIF
jgi:uncharacterized membrane protein YfcA